MELVSYCCNQLHTQFIARAVIDLCGSIYSWLRENPIDVSIFFSSINPHAIHPMAVITDA